MRLFAAFVGFCFSISCSLADRSSVILTNGFGIITDEDISNVVRNVIPKCWEFDPQCPTNYWQCLRVEDFSLECEREGELDVPGEYAYLGILRVKAGNGRLEFSPRRPFSLAQCQFDIQRWIDLLRDQDVACFSASFPQYEEESDATTWLLNEVKSSRGSWSYFEDGQSQIEDGFLDWETPEDITADECADESKCHLVEVPNEVSVRGQQLNNPTPR